MGQFQPDGTLGLRCESITVTRPSSVQWRKFRYELKMSPDRNEMVGTATVLDEQHDRTQQPCALRLFAKPIAVVMLAAAAKDLAITCMNMNGEQLAIVDVTERDSVAQFRRKLAWKLPGLPHDRLILVPPSGIVIEETHLQTPVVELVGIAAGYTRAHPQPN